MKHITIALLFCFSTASLQAQSICPENDSLFYGIFEEGLHNDLVKVNEYEQQLGRKPAMLMWYVGWWEDNILPFPLQECQNTWNNGQVPHVVWEPWVGIDAILSGSYDAQIEQFGKDIASFGNPVMLRWGHEFNGDWYPWSYTDGTAVPASKWIEGFTYVQDKINSAGGTNAQWLWSPNCGNGEKNSQNMVDYYPGDDYVDWIAIDGYNWGTTQDWSSWASFADVFKYSYDLMVQNFPSKPIMLGEFGCANEGGDKAAWIDDLFYQLNTQYPQIKAFIWFNVNKETDWRFNATDASTTAFRNGLAGSRFSVKPQNIAAIATGKCGQKSIALKKGWNLIGYPLDNTQSVETAFASVWEFTQSVKNTDGFYLKGHPDYLQSLKDIEWSTGYFINVTENCLLSW